jgi:hypothetical protein
MQAKLQMEQTGIVPTPFRGRSFVIALLLIAGAAATSFAYQPVAIALKHRLLTCAAL